MATNMNYSVDKTKEILIILKLLFLSTDDEHVLKYLDYVREAKDKYNVEIDRRRVAHILDDLEEISNSKHCDIVPFKIQNSKKGKGKLQRGTFVLSDKDIERIIIALQSYQLLSGTETKELCAKIIENFSSVSKREYLANLKTDFRTLKVDEKTSEKSLLESNTYRQKFIITNDTMNGSIETFPKISSAQYFNKELTGYFYRYICLHNRPYVVVMLSDERIAFSVPAENISFLDNKKDIANMLDEPFVFDFSFQKGHQYRFIKQWVDKLISNETGDLEVVTLRMAESSYSNKIIKSLETFFPNQKIQYRILPIDFPKYDSEEYKKQPKQWTVEYLMASWDSFLDWFKSDVNIAKEVEILSPSSFADRIANFGLELFIKNFTNNKLKR